MAEFVEDDRTKYGVEPICHANQRVYGAKKLWKSLNRGGIRVARCTVARLMKGACLRGEVDRHVGINAEADMLGEFGALIPGKRAASR